MSINKPSSGVGNRCVRARKRVRTKAIRPFRAESSPVVDLDKVFDAAHQQALNPHSAVALTSFNFPNDSLKFEYTLQLSHPKALSLEDARIRADDFETSAASQKFKVSSQEILDKEAKSDVICDLRTSAGMPVLFASVLKPGEIFFNGGWVVLQYLNGLIVDQRFARRGFGTQFLASAGKHADFVIGHTQNPRILAGLRKAYRWVFPSCGRELNPAFANAVFGYLKSIGRPGYADPSSGLVRDLYDGPLYDEQPDGGGGEFESLKGGDGILVIASNSEKVFAAAVNRHADLNIKQSIFIANRSRSEILIPCDSSIIGGGHAGGLHVSGIRKAAAQHPELLSGKVMIVERNPAVEVPAGIPSHLTIADANLDPDQIVMHVATGPADRLAVIREAVKRGHRKFILEKPLTSTQADLDELLKLVTQRDLKIVVNFPWLDTPLTRALKETIDSGKHGKLLKLFSLQTKSRRGRLNEAAGHEDSFDIETPHQLSLALHLAGHQAILQEADCKPLIFEDGKVSLMGGASIRLRHHNGVESHLKSDLDSHIKERRIELTFEDGSHFVGGYPNSGETDVQYLWQYDPAGHLLWRKTFSEDPLASLFVQTYRHFAGIGPSPISTLDIAVATANLISEAKCYCGLEVQALESLAVRGAVR